MNAAGATHPQPPAVQDDPSAPAPSRRVREEAKDGLAVIAFSAATSVVLALLLVALTALAT